jgi:hypothetical protein
MRKISLLIALAVGYAIVATPANAQQITGEQQQILPRNAVVYHHEMSADYGFSSTNDVVSTLVSALVTVTTLTGINEQNFKYTGNFALAYKYRFNRVASLGAIYAFGSQSADIYTGQTFWGKRHSSYHTLAVECDFRYLTRKVVTLYSTLGAGATLYTRADTQEGGDKSKASIVLPNIQVSLVGAKIGTYRAGGMVELGFGYKGIINVGAYVRF